MPFRSIIRGKSQLSVHFTCWMCTVYCTEPKATCRQCKNQPNAYNMYTDLEGILSACLYLHVSFNSGVVHFCRYILAILALLCNTIRRSSIELLWFQTTHSPSIGKIQIYRKNPPQRILRQVLIIRIWLDFMKTTCRLGFCLVSTFNDFTSEKPALTQHNLRSYIL